MNPTRLLLTTLLAGGSATVAGCKDTTPLEVSQPAPAGDLLGRVGQLLTLLRCTPLPTASTSATIGPAGSCARPISHEITPRSV